MITLPDNDWSGHLNDELSKPYMQKLLETIEAQYEEAAIYPPKEHLFAALKFTSFANTKVVILGQDPYHGHGQAHGLSFSVQKGVKLPPSLRNIYKELVEDMGCELPAHGYLESWARQGVLLLNTVLTVQDGKPASHQKLGWETFTDKIIKLLSEREQPTMFVLWGKHAQDKAKSIDTNKHGMIASVHPSPLAARNGFFGSKPFSRANEFLIENGIQPIDWRIAD
ncbi:uracil-DNA glycosylase [Paenibacillus paeoniae]|uniref:Uracil-DNA glycosylase n=1 Tax=Paenibacillus paeoniae TaxID=2292705 RepID=A0A371PJA4_9BACL|nr:uracil-DNA glycosylase [Paenibacillus paeoniae]REK76291.1 uracil-DNA glycosylase [Paenibacillus paeoniae]